MYVVKARHKIYREIPEWLLGFDTETTGLSTQSDQAISYGFALFRFGRLVRTEHFYVRPSVPIHPAASRVHGHTLESLIALSDVETMLSPEQGVARAVAILREHLDAGAVLAGANVVRFDLSMLMSSYQTQFARSLAQDGLDLANANVEIIDVIEHDRVMEPSFANRPRRGLEHLCRHYGVAQGGHHALGDAIATVEVFKEQAIRNSRGRQTFELGDESDSIEDELARLANRRVQRPRP
jgi:DNA polymerase III subunit epsilon